MFNVDVDESLFDEEREQSPGVVWHGQYGHPAAGTWTLDVEAVGDEQPLPFWSRTQIRYGRDPNAPLVDVWQTSVLRCVPIAVRQRWIVRDGVGAEHYYPMFTKKQDRVPGTPKSHVQVLAVVDGLSGPVVIGLKGQSKTVPWTNPENGRFHDQRFPIGVEAKLKDYTKRANKQHNKNMPWLLTWVIDLRAAVDSKGAHIYVEVGSGNNAQNMMVFTVDLRTNRDEPKIGLDSRYVQDDRFMELQQMRREFAKAWEDDWKKVDTMQQQAAALADELGGEVAMVESDEDVPF